MEYFLETAIMGTVRSLVVLMIVPCFLYRESESTLVRDGITQLLYVDKIMSFDQAEKRCKDIGSYKMIEIRSELEWSEVIRRNSIL